MQNLVDPNLDAKLFVLLMGVVLYKSVDLFACRAKISQSLVRISRVGGKTPTGIFHFRKHFRQSDKARMPTYSDFLSRRFWVKYQILASLERDFVIYLMGLVFSSFLIIGFATLALKGQRSADDDKLVTALFTIFISCAVSVAAALVEFFRLAMERRRI